MTPTDFPMLAVKPGAVLDRLHPAMWPVLVDVAAAAGRAGVGTVWITSGADGKHKPTSLHYPANSPDGTLRALDFDVIDPRPTPKLAGMREMLKARLRRDYDVLLEDAGGENEHLHVEYQPKGAGA